MTELEKIEYAKSFIDKLANGINPIDGTQIPEGDIVNNVRLSRCFFYVSDILRQVIENGGLNAPQYLKRIKKLPFSLTEEQKSCLRASARSKSISEIADRLNELIDQEAMTKISAASISAWLVHVGFLEQIERNDGKKHKRPTPAGTDMGIVTEERNGQYGNYIVVLYPSNVQQFIFDNIDAIVGYKSEQNDPLAEFHSRPWTEEHVSKLTEMFAKNKSVTEMAYELKRTEGGIRSQLSKIGLIN